MILKKLMRKTLHGVEKENCGKYSTHQVIPGLPPLHTHFKLPTSHKPFRVPLSLHSLGVASTRMATFLAFCLTSVNLLMLSVCLLFGFLEMTNCRITDFLTARKG